MVDLDSQISNLSSEDEDKDEIDDFRGKTGLLFLIDFRENMLRDEGQNSSYFRKSIEACKAIMMHTARLGKLDLIGVYIFGTERSSIDSHPMIEVIQDLGPVNADRIKDIDRIIIDKGEALLNKCGHANYTNAFPLAKALKFSRKVFADCPKTIYNKTVVLMTTDDNPCREMTVLAHHARKEASKLALAIIELNIIGVGEGFDPNRFYNELISISRGEEDPDWRKEQRVRKLDNLDAELKSFTSRLSRTFRNLILGGNVTIPVALFTLYKEPKPKIKSMPVEVNLADDYTEYNQNNDSASTATNATTTQGSSAAATTQGSSTAATTQGSSAKRFVRKEEEYPTFLGQVIRISREVLDKALLRTDVGLTLIGFMQTKNIPEYLSVSIPKVMLPNFMNKDGREAFNLLLESCQEKGVSMICWYMYNKTSLPSLVACHPMTEQTNNLGKICPRAFCVVNLPFEDDYTDPDSYSLEGVPQECQVKAAKEIVSKMSSNYYPAMFHDKGYQQFLAMTEALALDFDDVESVEDDTDVNLEDISEMLGDLSEEFMRCPFNEDKKTSQEGPPAKMRKVFSDEELLDLIKKKKAENLTMAQLKSILESKGYHVPSGKKKADLVAMAYDILR